MPDKRRENGDERKDILLVDEETEEEFVPSADAEEPGIGEWEDEEEPSMRGGRRQEPRDEPRYGLAFSIIAATALVLIALLVAALRTS